jgi:hypothetical protein
LADLPEAFRMGTATPLPEQRMEQPQAVLRRAVLRRADSRPAASPPAVARFSSVPGSSQPVAFRLATAFQLADRARRPGAWLLAHRYHHKCPPAERWQG